MIRAGLRTDSMIGVAKFGIRKLKNFMLHDFWPTIQFLSMANTFSCLNRGEGALAASQTMSISL